MKQLENKLIYSCIRKKSFSLKAAETVITKLMQDKRLMYYYRCELCNAYHLTSKEPKGKLYNVI